MSTAKPENKPKRRGAPEKCLFKKGNKMAVGRGRPKKDRAVDKLCKLHTVECVEGLINIVRDDAAKDSDKISAITAILGYGWGKPKANVDLTTTYDVTGDFLEALKAVNRRRRHSIANSQDKLPPADIEDAEIVDSGS